MATLVDGRMNPAEEERAWTHVHTCPLCFDAVQREGWVKRQLAGLSFAGLDALPDELKGSLTDTSGFAAYPSPEEEGSAPRPRRLTGLAALGAGSLGAAMVGVIALSAAPADAPAMDRRAPTAAIGQPQSRTTTAGIIGRTGSSGTRRSGQTPVDDTGVVDAGAVARQVAVTVSAGMRMGL